MAALTKEKATLSPYTSPSSTPRIQPISNTLLRRQGILAQLCIRCGGYSGSDNEYCMKCRGSQWKTNPLMRDYDEVYRLHIEEKKALMKQIKKKGEPEDWLLLNTERTKRERKERKVKCQERLNTRHTGTYCVECKRSEKQSKSNLCLICDAKKRRRERDKREKLDKSFLFEDITPRRQKKTYPFNQLDIVPENPTVNRSHGVTEEQEDKQEDKQQDKEEEKQE